MTGIPPLIPYIPSIIGLIILFVVIKIIRDKIRKRKYANYAKNIHDNELADEIERKMLTVSDEKNKGEDWYW